MREFMAVGEQLRDVISELRGLGSIIVLIAFCAVVMSYPVQAAVCPDGSASGSGLLAAVVKADGAATPAVTRSSYPSFRLLVCKANSVTKKSGYGLPDWGLKVSSAVKKAVVSSGPAIAKTDSIGTSVEKKTKTAVAGTKQPPLEIPDIVIDRTSSPMGENFVDLFNDAFNPPSNGETYVISIEERPLPWLGTLVYVKVNGEPVFKSLLQPRYSSIRQVAEKAAGVVSSYVANYQEIQKNLEGEDMSGSGIY